MPIVDPPVREPFGKLPKATTTAEPQWIPYRIRAGKAVQADERERHFSALRQLTFDGKSGAAAWSADSKSLLYESSQPGANCWQINLLDLETGSSSRVSPERGWARSGAFGAKDSRQVLFAFSDSSQPNCRSQAEMLRADRWVLPACDIYSVELGDKSAEPVVASPSYDAELNATSDGSLIVFTSLRDGDPELYVANAAGAKLRRVTHTPGYDGGASFSPDGSKLTWHAQRPRRAELGNYRDRLAAGVVEPKALDILMAGQFGQHPQTVVRNGSLNIDPSFFPDSRRIIFASSRDDPDGHGTTFELYAVDPTGPATSTGRPAIERLTFHEGFDGAPRWSPDGRYVAFVSSRFANEPGDTNLFVARWEEDPD